jgi:segregation and condensation protein A
MDALTYKLEQFEGPLDLLLTLIQKNKVSITDIPIALICDQYIEYISKAEALDMDLASEFIVMASELMLIKTKMLLPKAEDDEEDPRATLTDALLRYQQAKEASQKLAPLYAYFSGRMVKYTDEISIDKTFVQDQDVTALCAAVRRIVAYNNALEQATTVTFKPMISKPIIPVEIKIVSIIKKIEKQGAASLEELLINEPTLPDTIASFLGILELIKVRKLLISDSVYGEGASDNAVLGANTRFIINENKDDIEQSEYLLDTEPDNADDVQMSINVDGE